MEQMSMSSSDEDIEQEEIEEDFLQRQTPIRKEQPTDQVQVPAINTTGPTNLDSVKEMFLTWEELRQASVEFSARGLYSSAKWAAEMLANIQQPTFEQVPTSRSTTPNPIFNMTYEQQSKYLLAKSYFDTKEYRRAAHVLQTGGPQKQKSNPVAFITSSNSDSSDSLNLFLCCYSLYLAGEKQREQQINEGEDDAYNTELHELNSTLSDLDSTDKLDSFLLYLYGVVLRGLKQVSHAKKVFVKAVNKNPTLWCAWLELSQIIAIEFGGLSKRSALGKQIGDFAENLPDHWVKDFFIATLALELQQNEEAISGFEDLLDRFGESPYTMQRLGIANHNLREFERSEYLFDRIRQTDPYSLDGLDVFSNILYVQENSVKLSYLAHSAMEIDKYRPETCCVVGNYYSMKGEHQKAVVYFRRALQLNRHFLSAWTLMGHEFVELKQWHTAIHAYRKAVELNPLDYRAWYGLGQTYEILKMFVYSLHYYSKAASLRPYDSRMWYAMAAVYERLKKLPDAIKCYERADMNKDGFSNMAVASLARLHSSMNRDDLAAFFYRKNLQQSDNEGVEGQETIDALMFLANYYKKRGEFEQAKEYCARLLDYEGREKEDAKAMLREMRSSDTQQTVS